VVHVSGGRLRGSRLDDSRLKNSVQGFDSTAFAKLHRMKCPMYKTFVTPVSPRFPCRFMKRLLMKIGRCIVTRAFPRCRIYNRRIRPNSGYSVDGMNKIESRWRQELKCLIKTR
jgi:hypothetical protein